MGPTLDCCECFVAMKRLKPFSRQRHSPQPQPQKTHTPAKAAQANSTETQKPASPTQPQPQNHLLAFAYLCWQLHDDCLDACFSMLDFCCMLLAVLHASAKSCCAWLSNVNLDVAVIEHFQQLQPSVSDMIYVYLIGELLFAFPIPREGTVVLDFAY